MFFESAVIILIIVAVGTGLKRTKKIFYIKTIMPLISVPFVNILLLSFSSLIGEIAPNSWNIVIIIVYTTTALISILLAMFYKKYINDKKYQIMYILAVIVFLSTLLFIFMRENLIA